MSVTVGSCSSGSSGPRPKTSSSTSLASRSALAGAEGHAVFAHQLQDEGLQSLRGRRRVLHVQQLFQIDLVDQLAMDRRLHLLLGPRQHAGLAAAGPSRADIACRGAEIGNFSHGSSSITSSFSSRKRTSRFGSSGSGDGFVAHQAGRPLLHLHGKLGFAVGQRRGCRCSWRESGRRSVGEW